MLVGQGVLPLTLLKMLGGVDKQDIIGLLALDAAMSAELPRTADREANRRLSAWP